MLLGKEEEKKRRKVGGDFQAISMPGSHWYLWENDCPMFIFNQIYTLKDLFKCITWYIGD
jgi:hypothetical protein